MALVWQMDDVTTNNFDDSVQTSYLMIVAWTFFYPSIVLHLLCEHHPCLGFECFL